MAKADLEVRVAALESVLLETRLTLDAVVMGLASALGEGRGTDFRLAAELIEQAAQRDENQPAAVRARAHAVGLLHHIANTLDAGATKAACMATTPKEMQ